MRYGNCWIFALRRWWREGPRETYLVVRISRHTWVPHVFFAPSIDGLWVEEFKPLKGRFGWLVRWFPLYTVVFRGRVRRGVGEEHSGTKVGRVRDET